MQKILHPRSLSIVVSLAATMSYLSMLRQQRASVRRVFHFSTGAKETQKERRKRLELERLQAKDTLARQGNLVIGKLGKYEVVVGMEVHAQIAANQKLFSAGTTSFGVEPNSHVALVDAAFPGTLPRLNLDCVQKAVQTALALKATVRNESMFDRKHYFYPDMPAGFQITQYRAPLAFGGALDVPLTDGSSKTVTLAHLQLEQDSGKTVQGNVMNEALVDLNRAGSALMEIVSNPDMRSSEEAGAYARALQRLLRGVGSCSGNMDQGDMRCDVNVSVRRPGEPLGARVEVKNVNSVRFLCSAIDFEVDRQIRLLESGETVSQETRNFDSRLGETVRLRSKEDTVDYRFLPEPDVPPLHVSDEEIARLAESLPTLPFEQQQEIQRQHGLSAPDAILLLDEPGALTFFNRLLELGLDARTASSWLLNDLLALVRAQETTIELIGISPFRLAELIGAVKSGVVSKTATKKLLALLGSDSRSVAEIVEANGWSPMSETQLQALCEQIVHSGTDDAAVQKAVARARSGDQRALRFFIGQAAKQSQGRADPQRAERIFAELLQKMNES